MCNTTAMGLKNFTRTKAKSMPYSESTCTDTNKCIPLRKGLSAIAKRRTGIVVAKTSEIAIQAQNIVAPKEIIAAKCASISLLSL